VNFHSLTVPGSIPFGLHSAKPHSEKVPVPCEHCRATGLAAGIECRECAGKGYRVSIGGDLTNTAKLGRSMQQQQQHKIIRGSLRPLAAPSGFEKDFAAVS
jgi:hypothetical protein